ncbi:MAG: HAD family phosphatase [Candidatus Sumerlaeia bacterium]|nr:HAD family phosphatase [Candidatus Sumerlaeia bacterium]
MPPFGVIFDADGVLFDSERQSLEALRMAIAELTNGAVSLDSQRMDFICGRDDNSIVSLLNTNYGLALDPAHFRSYKLDCYRRAMAADPISMAAGAETLLRQLEAEQIPFAIATGAIRAKLDLSLSALGLLGRFSTIVSADEVASGKPDPEIFLLAARRLALPPRRLVVIEDTVNGIIAANRAGMLSVGVIGTFTRDQLAQARHVVSSLHEICVERLRSWIDAFERLHQQCSNADS